MNILLFNFNNVLTEVGAKLQEMGHTLLEHDGKKETLEKADILVVWNESAITGSDWRDMIRDLRKKGKRVVLVQHGRKGTSRIYPPFNEELVSDVVCVWGENDKRRLMDCGVDEDRIHVCGTTIFQHLKPRVEHKGYNVVFSPEHWDIDVTENWEVARELRKLKKVNVITKGLEGHNNPLMYDNLVTSDRNSPEHWDVVSDVLSKADAVVAISESTFELLAQSLDIPVIIADNWVPKACAGDDRYKEYKREYSDAVAKVPIHKLNKTIKLHLEHPELLREERKRVVIGDGGTNIKDPLQEIIKVILNEKDN